MFSVFLASILGLMPCARGEGDAPVAPAVERVAKVVVIPVRQQIAKPELYILRRGLKEAIDAKADTIVLDMETPGGALDVTFEMLKALEKFPGRTVTYINREAISAGALISAGTDEIYFAPGAVIGAAAPVMATGGEIDPTMREKIVSYLKARVRAISEGKGYRGEVISAMIDRETEFKIGEQVIKPKGELLSLTAQEAMKRYGEPAVPLLGAGIAGSIDELLDQLHGAGNHRVVKLEVTWSEELAQYLTLLTPLLLGGGLLCLFVEFKTPGFGFFGVTGILLLAVVFFAQHAAGLSGHEPALIFALGLVMVLVDLFFIPGMVLAMAGGVLMFGSLVWAMADLWPQQPITVSGDVFVKPLLNVLLGVLLAVVMFIALLRFMPRGGLWGRMVLEAAVAGHAGGVRALNDPTAGGPRGHDLVGAEGVAATALFPSGQVEIAGRRYEARLEVGSADVGARVRVVGAAGFSLTVEVLS